MAATQVIQSNHSSRTICVGGNFWRMPPVALKESFPSIVLSQSKDFTFTILPSFDEALQAVQSIDSIKFILIDADGEDLAESVRFVEDVRRSRPHLPVIVFTTKTDDRARYLLRAGAAWHFTKKSKAISRLREAIARHVSGYQVAARSIAEPSPTEHYSWPIANPYIVGRPLTARSESMFVGRDDLFAWFEENLIHAGHPNTLLLFGHRRTGKTSVLYQVVQGQRGRRLRDNPQRQVFPVYIDLQRLSGSPAEEWLLRFAREVYRQAAPRILLTSPPENAQSGETSYSILERMLDRLETALPANGLILLAIDELEQLRADIEAGNLEPAIMPFLRSQIQHREGIAFLFSGSNGLLEDFWAPIRHLSVCRELGPLAYDEARHLILQPIAGKITVDDSIVERIWTETGGSAYAIQFICHRLVSIINSERRIPSRVTVADVEAVLQELKSLGFFPAYHPAISLEHELT